MFLIEIYKSNYFMGEKVGDLNFYFGSFSTKNSPLKGSNFAGIKLRGFRGFWMKS